jgi:large subunit ribosomal protein L16
MFYNYKRKNRLKFLSFKSNKLKFGIIGLKAINSGTVSLKQIELLKQVILKSMAYKVKIWNRRFFCFNITKKPIGLRMGKGHGKISLKVLKVSCGDIVLEFSGLKYLNLLNIIYSFKHKLSIKTKLIINKFKYFGIT